MALEEILDNLDGLDEKYKDLYVENSDGKFEISIDGLKSALVKERAAKKELEKKVSSLSKKDTPDPTIDELQLELKQAQTTINDMKIHSKMKSAALAAGVDPDYVDDVVQLTKGGFKIDGDNVVGVDIDGSINNKTLDNFFKNEFKRNKPRFFVSSGRSGAGSHGSDDDGAPLSESGKIQKAIKDKNITELIKLKQSNIK